MPRFKVGDKVHFDADTVMRRPTFAGTFIVEKINKVNVKVFKAGVDALRSFTVNVNPLFLEAGEASAPEETVMSIPFPVAWGTLVYVKGATRIPEGFYVVSGETRSGYKLAPFGGRGSNWAGVGRAQFDVIEVTGQILSRIRELAGY